MFPVGIQEPTDHQPTYQDPWADGIQKPTDHDVKCGRGVIVNSHPGNEFFRSLVRCNKELYVMSTKAEKREIASSIITAIHSLEPPGRFVEHDPETRLWNEISHAKALEKTCQALRNGGTALKKRLLADLDNPSLLTKAFVAADTHAPVVFPKAAKNPETHLWLEGLGDKMTMETTNEATEKKAAGLPRAEQLSPALGDLDFLDTVFEKEAHSPIATEGTKQVYDKIPVALDLVGVDLFDTALSMDAHAHAVHTGGAKTAKRKRKPPAKKRQSTKRARALKIVKLPDIHPSHGVHGPAT